MLSGSTENALLIIQQCKTDIHTCTFWPILALIIPMNELRFKLKFRSVYFCIVTLVQLGPMSVCMCHTWPNPVEAGNHVSSYHFYSDCHRLPDLVPSIFPATSVNTGSCSLSPDTSQRKLCIFLMNVKHSLNEGGGEMGWHHHNIHLIQSGNPLHSLWKCNMFSEWRPCQESNLLCSESSRTATAWHGTQKPTTVYKVALSTTVISRFLGNGQTM